MDNINFKFIKAVEILEKNGMITSRKELAEKLHYKPSTFTEVLKGRSGVNSEALQNFCKIFNINLYWLFYGEGEMFNDSVPDKKPNREPLEYRVEKLETLLEKQGFVV